MTFTEWLIRGMEHYKQQGFTFELLTQSLMKINRPGQNNILRNCKNFKDEYETTFFQILIFSFPKLSYAALLTITQNRREDHDKKEEK